MYLLGRGGEILYEKEKEILIGGFDYEKKKRKDYERKEKNLDPRSTAFGWPADSILD